MICRLLVLHILVLLSTGYLIDQKNYFYINSSFHNMCFHFQQPAIIRIESPLLVPMGNHITVASFNDQVSAKFNPQYESELLGYNNYDSGQYWVGVKFPQQNILKKGSFQKIKIWATIGEKKYEYIFLAPLFRMPLNAIQIYPTNTLYRYQDWILISYLHKFKEVDAYIFQKVTNGSTYKLLQKSDWGFINEDSNTIYQRHKSKKSKEVTVQVTFGQQKKLISLPFAQQNAFLLEQNKYAFTIDDLLQKSIELSATKQSEL